MLYISFGSLQTVKQLFGKFWKIEELSRNGATKELMMQLATRGKKPFQYKCTEFNSESALDLQKRHISDSFIITISSNLRFTTCTSRWRRNLRHAVILGVKLFSGYIL